MTTDQSAGKDDTPRPPAWPRPPVLEAQLAKEGAIIGQSAGEPEIMAWIEAVTAEMAWDT